MSFYGDEHHLDVLEYDLNDRPASETFKEKKKKKKRPKSRVDWLCLSTERERLADQTVLGPFICRSVQDVFLTRWDGREGTGQKAHVSVLSTPSCGEHDILSVLVRAAWTPWAVLSTGTPGHIKYPALHLGDHFLINV